MTTPPGPPLPAWIQSILIWQQWPRFAAACRRRYGDVFAVRMLYSGDIVCLADPVDVKAVFGGSESIFLGGEAGKPLRGLVGESSLLLLDESAHRSCRKSMMPPFQRGAVVRQNEEIAAIAAEHVAQWPVGQEFVSAPEFSSIALELILRTVIGASDSEHLGALRRGMRAILDLSAFAFVAVIKPELQRNWPWRHVGRRIDAVDRLLHAEIQFRRDDPGLSERHDVLSMLVASTQDLTETLTDGELRDQLMTLLLAGHDTITAALSWLFERLVRHPEVLQRATSAARDDDDGYLDAVINEVLRVRPVIFEVRRVLAEPTDIGRFRLGAGTTVAPCIGLIHHDPRYYSDPAHFDPERFRTGTPPPNIWLPFGGGARRCLGATYSQVTMRVVLREVLRQFDVRHTDAPDEQARLKHAVVAPAGGARIAVDAVRAPTVNRP